MALSDLYGQYSNPVTPEILGLERQREYARQLMQMSAQPQGQMVSGRYVAPAFTQQLQAALNPVIGALMSTSADKKALQIAERLREKEAEDVNKFFQYQYGSPSQQVEMAGPYGAGVGEGGANVAMPTLTTPEIARNPQLAFQLAASSRNPILRQQLAEMLKGQKVGEGEKIIRYNPSTGREEVVAQGGEKYRAPLQTDTGTAIEYRDPNDPTKVLARVPKSQMPTAGQVVEREDGTYLVDTRTGQAKPVLGPQGQPLTGGKPLTEVQSNAIGFAARAIEANRIATNLENKGITNTGAIRTAVGSVAGMAPFVGEQFEQGVRSTFNVLPEILGGPSPDQQKAEQARLDFVTAILRPESGAAIGVQEAKNEVKKYFPQAGDSQEVIQQKQAARLKAIEGLKAKAGPSGTRQINKITEQASLSAQDQEALNWANSNPTDPRSEQIKQRLGR